MTPIVDAMSRLNGFISGKRDMSRKSATLGIALATVALAALPALAADYSVPDVDVDYNVADGVDVETGFEVDVKGIGYANHIGTREDYEDETHVNVDDTKAIDVVDFGAPVDVPSVVTDQSIVDEEFELGGMDYINTVTLSVDADTVQGDPDGVNEEQGEHNVQENKDVVTPILRQLLEAKSYQQQLQHRPADAANPIMRNAVDFSIASDGPITEDIAVNAAAGAFNLQANSMVVAVGIGLLGQSQRIRVRIRYQTTPSCRTRRTRSPLPSILTTLTRMSASIWCPASATNRSIRSPPQPRSARLDGWWGGVSTTHDAKADRNSTPLPPGGAAGIRQAQGNGETIWTIIGLGFLGGVVLAMIFVGNDESDDEVVTTTTSN